MAETQTFEGAKLALYLGDKLAVILRDTTPGLPYAGYWDLPGGGREGNESPLQCALRECHEELGLLVPENAVFWRRAFDEGPYVKWFFVARMPSDTVADVVFGNEGQRWSLMAPATFLAHPMAVPAFQERLAVFLKESDDHRI